MRRAKKRKPSAFDLRSAYSASLISNKRLVPIFIEEPGGLLSSEEALRKPGYRKDGSLKRGGEGEWVPPSRPKIIVMQSVRNDPLGQMYARNQISDMHFHAGRAYQELYAIAHAEIGLGGAVDFGQVPVDGSSRQLEITLLSGRRRKAARRIRSVDWALSKAFGGHGLSIVRAVLIEKIHLRKLGGKRQKTADFISETFHHCLTEVAIQLGYATVGARNRA